VNIEDVTVAVLDAGTFVPLSQMFAGKARKVYYYSPFESEFLGIDRCVIGDGIEHVHRLDDFMEPDVFREVGLWIFPDIGFGGLQKYLIEQGKLVWGSMGHSDLELYRTRFLKVLKECGLPVIHSEKCVGLTALSDYLKESKGKKHVKINRYRENMETWCHYDWLHTQHVIAGLAVKFGPLSERIVFVVQDDIETDIEIGYDGWLIDGQFPKESFSGYEKKNQLYLGSLLEYDKLPEAARFVNERFAPMLPGYRNFLATEIRMLDDIPYFIDPTNRMAGQTMEHVLETCTNLPEVILAGAQGQVIDPEFSNLFAAEATIHYKSEGDGWKSLRVPPEAERKTKLYRCCFTDGSYHFPPHKSDELGVVCGMANTIEGAIEDCRETFEALGEQPIWIEMEGFADLLKSIQQAEEEGLEFSSTAIPDPATVLE